MVSTSNISASLLDGLFSFALIYPFFANLPFAVKNAVVTYLSTLGSGFTGIVIEREDDGGSDQTSEHGSIINTASESSSSSLSALEQDEFGFGNLIFVATKVGRIAAIHSLSSQIVWTRWLGDFEDSNGEGVIVHDIIINRPPPLPSPEVTLVCSNADKSKWMLLFFDPLTGQTSQSKKTVPFSIVHSFPLSHHTHITILIDSEAGVHLLPNTKENRDVFFAKFAKTFSFYLVDRRAASVTGYALAETNGSQLSSTGGRGDEIKGFASRITWKRVFDVESEKIVAVAQPSTSEVVDKPAYILGDKSLLYKYVNPHLLVIATEATTTTTTTSATTEGSSSSTETLTSVRIAVIDAATGTTLHQALHRHSSGAAHVAVSENWLVYQIWNIKEFRYEFVATEFYEPSFFDFNDAVAYDLYHAPLPDVLSQSYIFPTGVSAMTVSQTRHGVSSKWLIVASTDGRIVAIDRRFIDPRRPLLAAYTPEHKEEGLLVYNATIPIIPRNVLSHYHRVENVRGMLAVPSKLESTSLLFCYGLDLFFTRIAPSKTYDVLSPEFNHPVLIISMVVLVVASVVTSRMANAKDLQRQWK